MADILACRTTALAQTLWDSHAQGYGLAHSSRAGWSSRCGGHETTTLALTTYFLALCKDPGSLGISVLCNASLARWWVTVSWASSQGRPEELRTQVRDIPPAAHCQRTGMDGRGQVQRSTSCCTCSYMSCAR